MEIKLFEFKFELKDSKHHLITGFFIFLFLFSSILQKKNRFERASFGVYRNYESPLSHLVLAATAADLYDWRLSQKEYALAVRLAGSTDSEQLSQYKALSAEVKSEIFAEEMITNEIQKWKTVLKKQPTYRDAHIYLAYLYYQLSDDERAQEHINRAWELDPNNKTVQSLRSILYSSQ